MQSGAETDIGVVVEGDSRARVEVFFEPPNGFLLVDARVELDLHSYNGTSAQQIEEKHERNAELTM